MHLASGDRPVAPPRDKVKAALYLLDRGWGRPPVAMSLYFEDDEPHQEGDEGERIIPVLASILADIAAQEEREAREVEAEVPKPSRCGG